MPLADYVDIGVFKGNKDEEKPLSMQREKITREHRRERALERYGNRALFLGFPFKPSRPRCPPMG